MPVKSNSSGQLTQENTQMVVFRKKVNKQLTCVKKHGSAVYENCL